MSLDMKFNARNMNTKQKVLIPLIILAFAFVIWQFYSMFGSSSNSSAATKTPENVAPTAAVSTKTVSAPAPASVPAQASAPGQVQPSTSVQAPAPANANELAPTGEQSQYIQLMGQYQLLKMKRMLLEEEVAIATARQKIADLNSKTGELGGEVGSADVGDSDIAYSSATGDYKVVFIDRQGGEWNATLSRGGRFEEVDIGSELADGTQVISIDSKGVVIKKGLKLTRLTFSGSAPIEETNVSTKATAVSKEENIPAKPDLLQSQTEAIQQTVTNKQNEQDIGSVKKKALTNASEVKLEGQKLQTKVQAVSSQNIQLKAAKVAPLATEKTAPVATTKLTAKPALLPAAKSAPVSVAAEPPPASVTTTKTTKPVATSHPKQAPGIKLIVKVTNSKQTTKTKVLTTTVQNLGITPPTVAKVTMPSAQAELLTPLVEKGAKSTSKSSEGEEKALGTQKDIKVSDQQKNSDQPSKDVVNKSEAKNDSSISPDVATKHTSFTDTILRAGKRIFQRHEMQKSTLQQPNTTSGTTAVSAINSTNSTQESNVVSANADDAKAKVSSAVIAPVKPKDSNAPVATQAGSTNTILDAGKVILWQQSMKQRAAQRNAAVKASPAGHTADSSSKSASTSTVTSKSSVQIKSSNVKPIKEGKTSVDSNVKVGVNAKSQSETKNDANKPAASVSAQSAQLNSVKKNEIKDLLSELQRAEVEKQIKGIQRPVESSKATVKSTPHVGNSDNNEASYPDPVLIINK